MNKNLKIPLILVTGFLGAGKTTYIRQLLNKYADDRLIGIIQNEYASANIDTAELSASGKKLHLLEINKGSVFCVCLLANFIDSLAAFIDSHSPDLLVIESSGLSDPINIAEIMQHEKLSGKTFLLQSVCIIDLVSFHKVIQLSERLKRQIMIADTILLNKLDTGQEAVEEVSGQVRRLNPFAELLETSFCRTDNYPGQEKASGSPVAERMNFPLEPFGKVDIKTVVLRTTRTFPEKYLDQFISEIEQRCIRIKGFINLENAKMVSVQSEFGKTRIKEIDYYAGPTELIGIGYNISTEEFGRRFHELRKGIST
jgi:G3E family GTPase